MGCQSCSPPCPHPPSSPDPSHLSGCRRLPAPKPQPHCGSHPAVGGWLEDGWRMAQAGGGDMAHPLSIRPCHFHIGQIPGALQKMGQPNLDGLLGSSLLVHVL